MGRASGSVSIDATDTHPRQLLRWQHVEEPAAAVTSGAGGIGGSGGGGDGDCGGSGGGCSSRPLVEAILEHQDAANSLYGEDLRWGVCGCVGVRACVRVYVGGGEGLWACVRGRGGGGGGRGRTCPIYPV